MNKLKKILILLISIVIFIGLVFAFYYFKTISNKEVLNKDSKPQSVLPAKQEETDEIEKIKTSLKAQEMKNAELEATIKDLKLNKNIASKSDVSLLTLTLFSMENKFNTGGSIVNDVIKLKVITVKLPEIKSDVEAMLNIGEIKSRTQLLEEFNYFVKEVKSLNAKEEGGRWSYITSFIFRYFAVLNNQNALDQKLILTKAFILENNFIQAFKQIEEIEFETKTEFYKNLQNASIVQNSINNMYLLMLERAKSESLN